MPHSVHGKICYVQIPATDVERSAAFYRQVFGWNIRERGDSVVAFDDGLGEVSGQWVTGRPPMVEPGLLFYIMATMRRSRSRRSRPRAARSCSRSAAMPPRSRLASATPAET
jgi:predicted enzyme related to lactoylglutathione lyase